jgi:hypothetical protein
MVLAAMGAPQSKLRELVPGSTDKHYEEWIYGQAPQTVRFVRFVGDRVIQVRVAALGQPIAIHDQNELHGYLDPGDSDANREIALGDPQRGNGDSDSGRAAPPSILKPGEVAPGSSIGGQVQMPVSAPDKDSASAKDKDSAPANPSATSASSPSAASDSQPADSPNSKP